MAERTGKIRSYNPTNRQGEIAPEGGGPVARFYVRVVTNGEVPPKAGDTVLFDAPELRKNKQGKVVQGDATSVTITERSPELPARPKEERRLPGGGNIYGKAGRAKGERRGKGDRERRGPREDRRPRREGGEEREARPRRTFDRAGRGEGRERRAPAGRPQERRPRRPRLERPKRTERKREEKAVAAGVYPLPQDLSGLQLSSRELNPTLLLEKLIPWPQPKGKKPPAAETLASDNQNTETAAAEAPEAEQKPTEQPEQGAPQSGREKWLFHEKNRAFVFQKLLLPALAHQHRHRLPWDHIVEQWRERKAALEREGFTVVERTFRSLSDVVLQLGRFGVIDGPGVILHRHFGYPLIPAQILKGVARAMSAAANSSAEERRAIFGEQGEQGAVIFFDATPARRVTRVRQSARMPHFGDYYARHAAPDGQKNPHTASYMSVAAGSTFHCRLAVRPGADPNLGRRAMDLLLEGSKLLGAGALAGIGLGALGDPRHSGVENEDTEGKNLTAEPGAEPLPPT